MIMILMMLLVKVAVKEERSKSFHLTTYSAHFKLRMKLRIYG